MTCNGHNIAVAFPVKLLVAASISATILYPARFFNKRDEILSI